jgi:hypothetical protein
VVGLILVVVILFACGLLVCDSEAKVCDGGSFSWAKVCEGRTVASICVAWYAGDFPGIGESLLLR